MECGSRANRFADLLSSNEPTTKGLNLFPFAAMHGDAFEFAVGFALFDVFAFVEDDFAFADGELDFDFVVLPIERKRHDGLAFDRGGFVEFANLGLVEEQLARRFGLMIFAVWVWGTADTTTVIVVRHAEKDLGSVVDPPLNVKAPRKKPIAVAPVSPR